MARSRSILSLARRFATIDPRRRALLTEAVLCLAVARMALVLIPFPAIARRIGTFVPPSDPRTRVASPHPADAALASEIRWAVTRGAHYGPGRSVCLPQALAAHVMLRRRGIKSVMHLGAARTPNSAFEAHAWLDAAGVEVTGYPVANGFAEIACFV